MMPSPAPLTPGLVGSLTPERLEFFAVRGATRIEWSAEVLDAVTKSERALAAWRTGGGEVYGVTTGVGPLVDRSAGQDSAHVRSILDHLVAGAGPPVATEIVRGAWVLRLHTLARGHSGVRPALLEWMGEFLAADEWPDVPSIGSLGASGDLVPLAHVAVAFRSFAGARGFELNAREALALVNGTSFLTAAAALATARFERLIERMELHTAELVDALGAARDFLHPELHEARGHPGQIASARRILELTADRSIDVVRPLQERYSLRCAPQIIGAAREVGGWCRDVVTREIDGVDDNPVIPPDADSPRVWHGGNFHGQLVAFATDAMNIAATKLAALAERQIALLLDPAVNGGQPPFLTPRPGEMAGLAGAQLTATALLAEMRLRVHPASAGAPESNLGNQDVVSLGFHAAHTAWSQMERLAGICAIEEITLRQYQSIARGEVDGDLFVDGDRALSGIIAELTAKALKAVG